MKLKVAALLIALLAGPTDAQDGTICKFPDIRFNPEGSHAEKLEFAIASLRLSLCTFETVTDPNRRYKPPGHDALVQSTLEAYNADLDLLISRLSFPAIAEYRAAYGRVDRDKHAGYWADYLAATEAIYFYDSCDADMGECAIELPITDAVRKRHGMELRPWVNMVAQTLRAKPMPPWFRLGAVSMRYEPNSVAYLRIKTELDDATRSRDEAMQALDKARAKVTEEHKKRSDILTPLRIQIEKDRRTLFEMDLRRRPDTDEVIKDPSWAAHEDIALRAEKRVRELDKAMPSVFATEGDTKAGQKRLREMQDERDAEARTADIAWSERLAMLQPDYTDKELEAREQIERDISINQQDHDRRQTIYDGWVHEAEVKVVAAQVKLDVAFEALTKAQRQMQKWRAGSAIAAVSLIETADARLTPADKDDLEQIQNLMRDLEKEISERETRRSELEAKREKARETMLEAGRVADEMNNRFAASGAASMFIQGAIEAGFSIKDFFKSGRGGPAAILAEAARQGVGLYLSPPSYYDATTKRLSDYARGHDTPSDWALVDIDSMTSRETLIKNLEKNFANLPLKTLVSSIEQTEMTTDLKTEWRKFKTADGNMWKQLKEIGDTEAELEKVTKELGEMTGRAGAFKAVKSFTVKMGEGIAKSLAKEATKKAVAELLEGHFFDEYMMSQVDLSHAVSRLQHAGGLYWSNEDLLAIARAKLSGLLLRDLGPSLLIDELNDPFYPKEDYRFRLEFARALPEDVQDATISVYVGGMKLLRDQGTTEFIWSMPEDAVERLSRTLPETLPIEIVVQ